MSGKDFDITGFSRKKKYNRSIVGVYQRHSSGRVGDVVGSKRLIIAPHTHSLYFPSSLLKSCFRKISRETNISHSNSR